jgi:hypothetical protein
LTLRNCRLTLLTTIATIVCIATETIGVSAADFAGVPGIVIAHRPASDGVYIGSPGIVILPDGVYLAKYDEFGPESTSDTAAVTRIYESNDRGKTWREKTKLDGVFWATLFLHRVNLYLLGTNRGGGDMIIRKSTDSGKTWTQPRDAKSGLLRSDAKYHCAPVPVVEHNGRLWRAMEDLEGPGKGFGPQFRAFMASAPADSDLLDAANWTFSNSLIRDPRGLERRFNGWLEGNAVVTPQGRIVNVLRTTIREIEGKAAVIEISDDGKTASFDPVTGFVDLPGGAKKFTIRFDPVSKRYWSLVNPRLPPFRHISAGGVRNTLALASSADLRNWDLNCVLVYHPDPKTHGYQYVDWVFEGDDVVAVARTAHDDGLGGAHNFHDANFLTFHRVEDFRDLTMADSVPSPITSAHDDE